MGATLAKADCRSHPCKSRTTSTFLAQSILINCEGQQEHAMSAEIDRDELAEELEHQRQLVKVLRRRRRLLEHTHVIKGIEADPHVLMQIEDISQQIKEREAEIARLQTLSVEYRESLAEIEYRVAVAETF